MSALPTATAALSRLLEAVDDHKLRQVVQLVEASGQRPRLEPALAALRPRLCRLRQRRPLTLQRLLTVPFEAALARAGEPDWPFSIPRDRLHDWHELLLAGLEPATVQAAAALIEGRGADDRAAIAAAGTGLWPAAAELLAADCPPAEKPVEQTARLRAAELAAVANELVPLLWRLPPRLAALEPEDQKIVGAILALAADGHPDRPGLLATIVLRRSNG